MSPSDKNIKPLCFDHNPFYCTFLPIKGYPNVSGIFPINVSISPVSLWLVEYSPTILSPSKKYTLPSRE